MNSHINNFAKIVFIAILLAFVVGMAPSAASANADLANVFVSGNGFVSGTVWQDTNRNGIMEPNELPLANREVYLQRTDGDVNGAMVAVVYTDADGMFKFTNLEFGEYKVFPDGGDYVLIDVQDVSATNSIELPVVIRANFVVFVPTVVR